MPKTFSYAHKIILKGGHNKGEYKVVVYVGMHPAYKKYINGWVTFKNGSPVPIPADWAAALVNLGDNRGQMFKYHDGADVPEGTIYAVKRNMGMGDVILVTPVLRAMRKLWPWAELHYYTEQRYMPLLRHNPDCIVKALEEGTPENVCAVTFDLIGVSERDSARMFQERVDVYARHCGVALKDKTPRAFSTLEEQAAGMEHLKEFGWDSKKPLLGVQIISSRPERDYDCARAAEVMRYWYHNEGYDVALFHNTEIDWDWGFPVVNMTGHTSTMARLMDAVSNCSLFFGVDSGVTHIAAAHGIPTVALCGAIQGKLRYACYPRCRIVERSDLKCVTVPHECYSCHRNDPTCLLIEPQAVIHAMGEVLCGK